MIKAAFFDIDGTLIPHGEEKFPESTLKALRLLKENNVKVFIATGRPVTTLVNALNQFDFDGYLALNGQYCMVDGNVVRNKYILQEDIEKALPYFQENNISCVFAEKDYVYVNMISQQYKEFHKGKEELMNKIDDVKRIQNQKTYQLMIFINEAEEDELFKHLNHCKSARWHPLFADVIPIDGGKNKGIDAIADYLHISLNEVIAFGDGGNDIDMLKYAGIGVAMGNADHQVKCAADYVTTDIKDNGIYNALKHYQII